MKYLKKFETEADKNAWLAGSEYVTPNVVLTGDVVGYNEEIDYSLLPLHIEAIESLTVKFSNNYEYSKNGTQWYSATNSTSVSASAGQKVYFRASGLTPSSSSGIGTFSVSNGTCNVAGNVMSMVYGADFSGKTDIANNYQFVRLFYNVVKIIDSSKMILPATTLTQDCYISMFSGCTSLVNAPELPATTLNTKCYRFMFGGCTSLVSAPALPATTLASYCYQSMFNGCTSLVNAPELPATTLASDCYSAMFYGCTSLVNAPELPATTLESNSYGSMFKGCTKLNYIKAMLKTIPSDNYTSNWVSGVSSTGTFVKNSAATWTTTGVNGIPEGWTVETADA